MTGDRRAAARRPVARIRRLAATGIALVARLVVAGLVVAGLVVAGLAASAGAGTATATAVLHPCPGQAGYECTTVEVPLRYGQPGSPPVRLAVAVHPATDPSRRIGALFLNPGGPGESGVQILPVLAGLLPPAVVQRFDLVSFDERGTGSSGLLVCGPTPAQVASVAPLPAKGSDVLPAAALYAPMARDCARRYPSLLPTVGTTVSAEDMDRIRAALGYATISYYGISYGTVLGSVYARLFPTRLRAAVLDGSVVVTQPLTQQATEEADAAEAVLEHAFAECPPPGTSCPTGGVPAALYRTVRARLERGPLALDGTGPPVTLGDLYTATLFYLTVPEYAPGYLGALRAAADGDGAPLRALSTSFEVDLSGTSLVGPEWAITCQDTTSRPSGRDLGALARRLAARDPLLGAYSVTYEDGGCPAWPRGPHPVTALRLRSGPRLLVLANEGDPNTPHLAGVQLTAALGRATLLTWDGWGHSWLLNGHGDACMADAVTTYLLTVRTPPANSACR